MAAGVPVTREADNESDASFESSHESPPENLESGSGGHGSYAEHQDQDQADSDDADYVYHPAQEHADEEEDEDEDYDDEDEHDDEEDEDDHDYFDGSGGLEFELVIDELAPGAHDDEEDDDENDNDAGNLMQRRILQILRGKRYSVTLTVPVKRYLLPLEKTEYIC